MGVSDEFMSDLRQELIDSGEVSKVFMDYLDERIKYEVDRAISHHLPQVEENLREAVNDEINKRFK